MYQDDELKHYGIPGMKWGVRKAVNEAINTARNISINVSASIKKNAPKIAAVMGKTLGSKIKSVSSMLINKGKEYFKKEPSWMKNKISSTHFDDKTRDILTRRREQNLKKRDPEAFKRLRDQQDKDYYDQLKNDDYERIRKVYNEFDGEKRDDIIRNMNFSRQNMNVGYKFLENRDRARKRRS